jgi:hypothetical protein
LLEIVFPYNGFTDGVSCNKFHNTSNELADTTEEDEYTDENIRGRDSADLDPED